MSQCQHTLNALQNVFASRTFRFKCSSCSQPLYREHDVSLSFFGPALSIWVIGLACFLFISFTYFLLAAGFVALAIIGSYIWDTKVRPLKVYCSEEKATNKRKSKNALLLFFCIITLGIIFEFTT